MVLILLYAVSFDSYGSLFYWWVDLCSEVLDGFDKIVWLLGNSISLLYNLN